MNEEIWKDIIGYEGFYKVSNLGNIKSLDRYVVNVNGARVFKKGSLIKTRKSKDGSLQVNLSKDSIKRTHTIARLVYKAFNPNFDYMDRKIIIWHKDNNQYNNMLENLIEMKIADIPMTSPHMKTTQFKKRSVMCVTTNKHFETIREAEDYYNIKKRNGNISRCCQGKASFAGKLLDGTKLVWKYDDKEKED
jgi:hypothetical protein